MGNCNSQALARGLEDTCGSGGANGSRSARAERRRRLRRSKNGGGGGGCGQSQDANSSDADDEMQRENGCKKANESKQSQVQLLDLGTDLGSAGEAPPTKAEPEPGESTSADVAGPESSLAADKKQKQIETATATIADQDQEELARKERLEKLKEGLDFIETEEDVKAVEAATLKIQSTFRGKKFRSKQAPKSAGASEQQAESTTTTKTTTKSQNSDENAQNRKSEESSKSELELSRKVAAMQVQDNNNQTEPKASASAPAGEDEAERAATKIQAGFKGYKTRKELEGKLPAGSAGGAADDDDKGGS